jgi:hypothetical protein
MVSLDAKRIPRRFSFFSLVLEDSASALPPLKNDSA